MHRKRALSLPLIAGLMSACAAPEVPDQLDDSAVRMANLSSGSALEMVVDGESAGSLDSMSGTDYLAMSPGEHTMEVFTDSGDREMAMEVDVSPNTHYTLALWGPSNARRGAIFEDALQDDPNVRRMRVINASEQSVRAWWNDGTVFGGELDIDGIADPVDLSNTEGTISVDVDQDGESDAEFVASENDDGMTENIYVIDSDDGIALVSQGIDGQLTIIEPIADAPGFASLRALHMSPNAPDVDVFLNRELSISGLPFSSVSGYAVVTEGSYDIAVSASGASAEQAVLSVPNLPLQQNTRYTAVAYGLLSNIAALALVDEPQYPMHEVGIRVAHTADGVGQVDVLVLDESGAGTPLVENLNFGDVSLTLDVAPAAYSVGLDVDDDGGADLIFDLVALDPGQVVTVFAVATAEGSVSLRVLAGDAVIPFAPRPAPQTALRVVHLSPDAPNVDVYANGILAVDDIPFLTGTNYQNIAVGRTDLDISPAGADLSSSVLTVAGVELLEDSNYTAVAFGSVTDLNALLLEDDFSPLPTETVRLRFLHTAIGVGDVNIIAIPTSGALTPLWEDVPFGGDGGYIEVPAGTYRVGVDIDDDHIPELSFELPNVEAGTVANVFALNNQGQVHVILQH